VSIKNDGHYFCRAGGNRPDGLNESVTPLLTVMCSVGDLLPRSGGGMACQAAGKPWQAYACLKCRRAAPAALPFLPVMV
ncbi:hypothetical protein U4U01_18245, partial [Escherichia coli]|nr:hypothetical protein [Escherichia coli]